MDDHVAVVEQHPLTLGSALITEGPSLDLFQTFLDVVGQGADLGSRVPGCDHEHLGDVEEVPHVEKRDVEALLVGQRIGDESGEIVRFRDGVLR